MCLTRFDDSSLSAQLAQAGQKSVLTHVPDLFGNRRCGSCVKLEGQSVWAMNVTRCSRAYGGDTTLGRFLLDNEESVNSEPFHD